MTQSSYPFDGQPTSESQYSQLFREFQDSGVVPTGGSLDLRVQADGSGMNVSVGSGFAIVRGHAYLSTETEVLPIAPASSSTRIDSVVLRLDPTANEITVEIVQGTPGDQAPSLTQTSSDIYEVRLADVMIRSSDVVVDSGSVTDRRAYVGTRVGRWSQSNRPSQPRIGQIGYNTTANSWEYWTGSAWSPLTPNLQWSQISDKPGSFPPSSHSHSWSDINAPSTFPPSSHGHTWNEISDKPSTYPPSSHSHSWSQITGKPSTFPPSSHSHSNYLTSSGTISRANGSNRPHNYGPSGSNWYAVWVDGNRNFCRNTSSIRFKENVRDFGIDPEDVLKLRPVIYDRKPTVDDEGNEQAGRKDEVGFIAEEVADAGLQWMVNYLDGQVDGLRYDLLGVALVPVVQKQAEQIASLEGRLSALEAKLSGGEE